MSVRPPCRSTLANYSLRLDRGHTPQSTSSRPASSSVERRRSCPSDPHVAWTSSRTSGPPTRIRAGPRRQRPCFRRLRSRLRASVQLLVNRIYRSPTEAEIESAVIEAHAAAEAFEVLDDDVGLAEAALAISYLQETRGRIADARLWASTAFRRALAAGHPREATQAAGDLVG